MEEHVRNERSESLEYLRTEFEVSWRHLGALEDKRLWLFVGFCVFLGLVLLAVSELAASGSQALVARAHFANALALLSVSFACRNIARSERQATERYRNKLNLLRRTILEIIGSAKLNAMQVEGNANALQIAGNAPKELSIADLADRRRWNTALFMKLVYDAGVFAGTVYLGMMLASAATAP